jgi:arylamine N-acetyltransferase
MWSADDGLAPDPHTALHVRETIARYAADPGCAPHAVVVTAPLRPLLAEFLQRTARGVAVYAFAELPAELVLEPARVIEPPPAPVAIR